MATSSDIKKGATIIYSGAPHVVTDFMHVNPGKGSSFVRTKLKNVQTGQVIDITFKAGDPIKLADTQTKNVSYLYNDGNNFYFMDPQSYEQFSLSKDLIGNDSQWMKEGILVQMTFLEGSPLSMQLPRKVELEVSEAPPGIKGDTATGGTKQITLETGVKIQAPLFIESGDIVRVNTESGEYVERI